MKSSQTDNYRRVSNGAMNGKVSSRNIQQQQISKISRILIQW